LFLLAGGEISWNSAKQSIIDASIIKVEFVVCFEATIQMNWLQNFISRPGVVDSITKLLKIYCDNSATVFFSKNKRYYKRAKYMELKYFVIKKEVYKQKMLIEHISTNLMIIDPLKKGFSPKIFSNHVK
jgi:hypothetical protein